MDAHADATDEEREQAMAAIEESVMEDIKARHLASPKYTFREPSQSEILERCSVRVQRLDAPYIDQPVKGAVISLDGQAISPEDFVAAHFQREGWSALPLESRPLHALFGVMMWLVIQDGGDPQVRFVGFGDRHIYEASGAKVPVWTQLPDDFGAKGYALRRAEQIHEHLAQLHADRADLLWHFDLWRPVSANLRQYLWAHRDEDVDLARRLIEILPPEKILAILRYLVDDYWGHYLGWPDLLLHRGEEILFAEVKSSKDRLSADQRRWIVDNHERLQLPFRLIKVHRKTV